MSFSPLLKLGTYAILFITLSASVISGQAVAKNIDDTDTPAIEQIVKDYLMKNPEIIREALQELERRTAEEEQQRQKKLVSENRDLLVDPAYSFVAGNVNGDITVVEFFDYNCPYCRQAYKDLDKLLEEDKNVRVVLKEYPILGEASKQASLAALAARKQNKYMEFHTALLSAKGRINDEQITTIAKQVGLDVDQLQKDMKSKEIEDILNKNIEVGLKLGINGTPTFIFNDEVIPQVLPYEAMKEFIAKLRKAS